MTAKRDDVRSRRHGLGRLVRWRRAGAPLALPRGASVRTSLLRFGAGGRIVSPMELTSPPIIGGTYVSRVNPATVVTVVAYRPDALTRGKGGIEIRGAVDMVRVSDQRPGTLSLPMFNRAYSTVEG